MPYVIHVQPPKRGAKSKQGVISIDATPRSEFDIAAATVPDTKSPVPALVLGGSVLVLLFGAAVSSVWDPVAGAQAYFKSLGELNPISTQITNPYLRALYLR